MRGSLLLTPKAARRKLEGISFLIVENERLMQVMIRQMLKDSGAGDLRFASNGAEAYRSLKANPVDMVISDWHMPGMTGIELLQTIKNDPDLFTTMVIIISSEASPLWVLCAVEEGVDGYLLKPFTQDNLLQTILDIRRKRPARGKRKIDEVIRLRLLGQYQEAIQLGEQLLGGEDNEELCFELAQCHFKTGHYALAQERVQEALGDTEDGRKTGLLATIHVATGQHAEAIALLEEAVKKNPLSFDRKMELLNAYAKSELWNQAAELVNSFDLTQLTDMNLVELARHFMASGDLHRAAECLKRTKEPLPETAKVFNSCASSLWKIQDHQESIKLYKRAINISPDYPVSYYNLGLGHCLMENYSEAKTILEKAIRLKPDYKKARELLEYVNLKVAPHTDKTG